VPAFQEKKLGSGFIPAEDQDMLRLATLRYFRWKELEK
jgi:hypothetical protein